MGSILAGTTEAESIEKITAPVKDLFGAIFFVSVGMLVEPAVLVQYLGPILFLTFVVVVGQIFYATLGFLAAGQNLKVAIQSSFSLAQIGEFAFIIASLGLTMGVTSSFLYPVAVAVSVVTTFTTPFIIRLSEPAYRWLDRIMPAHVKSLLQALRRRYSDRQHRARVDEVLEEVAAQYRALLDSAGGRRLDLFELLRSLDREQVRRVSGAN